MKKCLFFIVIIITMCSCNKEEKEILWKIHPLVFDKMSLVIPKEGGEEIISSDETEWDITYCQEINGNDTIEKMNEIYKIGAINYHRDTLTGDWYSIIKKENTLLIKLASNKEGKERNLLIYCNGYKLSTNYPIDVIQK